MKDKTIRRYITGIFNAINLTSINSSENTYFSNFWYRIIFYFWFYVTCLHNFDNIQYNRDQIHWQSCINHCATLMHRFSM